MLKFLKAPCMTKNCAWACWFSLFQSVSRRQDSPVTSSCACSTCSGPSCVAHRYSTFIRPQQNESFLFLFFHYMFHCLLVFSFLPALLAFMWHWHKMVRGHHREMTHWCRKAVAGLLVTLILQRGDLIERWHIGVGRLLLAVLWQWHTKGRGLHGERAH